VTPDVGTGDNSANYLRRLKAEKEAGVSADASAKGNSSVTTAMATLSFVERRKSPRLRCSGSVEFRVDGSDARLWGTLTDISLHGCYVEMNTTFPVDTKVHLLIKSCGVQIQTQGTVRATYPFLGMGIRLMEIEPGQQSQLKQLLDSLAGRNTVQNAGPAQDSGMKDALASIDTKAFIDEITQFFQKNPLLSREDFHKIAKRVRRS
jgi:hypothetical protein